jgi:single-strand DNA-binding protein
MYQKLTIAGNLGRDPEMRYTPNGQAVCTFPVATSRTYSGNDGQRVKETTWFRVSAWGKQAENCNNYLHKGSKVLVEGRLQADPQTGGPRVFDRNDGTSGASFEMTAHQVTFLDSKADGQSPQAEDEVPF